jgi:hypothetical protein
MSGPMHKVCAAQVEHRKDHGVESHPAIKRMSQSVKRTKAARLQRRRPHATTRTRIVAGEATA